MLKILLSYNIACFFLMGYDKYSAIFKRWRISEKCLILCASTFGSFGILLGMIIFRHKIRKPLFYITVPILVVIHTFVLYKLFF